MEKLNITKGTWFQEDGISYRFIKTTDPRNNKVELIAMVDIDKKGNDEPYRSLANAELIVEAGNVANETGLTPRELLKQRDELLEALQNLVIWSKHREPNEGLGHSYQHATNVLTAINKATE